MIFFWENVKIITNFTTNWCCNGCDQWHEAYKNARDIYYKIYNMRITKIYHQSQKFIQKWI